MLTLEVLECFEGNDDRNNIWSCARSPWHPLKRAQPKSKLDHLIQLNGGEVRTYASCQTASISARKYTNINYGGEVRTYANCQTTSISARKYTNINEQNCLYL